MKTCSSTYGMNVSSPPRNVALRILLAGLFAVLFLSVPSIGSQGMVRAQSGAFTPGCSPSIFHKAHISWTATERYLAAPDAPPDVVTAVTDVIEKVYRPDRTMDYTSLDALATPEYHEMTGLDCSGVPTPPTRPAPSAASPVAGSSEASPVAVPGPARLEQVRQTDDGIVSAFLVLPDSLFGPRPGATPASDLPVSYDGTPDPSMTVVYDQVNLVVFVQRDGRWMIDYLSGGFVQFSDVVPNDEQLRKSGATFGVDAIELRDHGMPALPADVTLIASPEATPAG